MSKAFTKESDAEVAEELFTPRAWLPAGGRHVLTPAGARFLRAELARLVEVERPPLLAAKEAGGEATALRRLEARYRDLNDRLEGGEVIAAPEDRGAVQLGATVAVREGSGEELEYRIVGPAEAGLEECWINAASPLARTLLGTRAGQTVRFRAPAGERKLQVVSVCYED